MKKLNLFILFIIISSISLFSQTKITPAQANNHIGEKVTITGTVDEVHITRTGTCFLNMGGTYPDNTFTAVIFKSDISKFGDVQKYEGKEVEISGLLKEYQHKPEIILNYKKQIKVLILSNR